MWVARGPIWAWCLVLFSVVRHYQLHSSRAGKKDEHPFNFDTLDGLSSLKETAATHRFLILAAEGALCEKKGVF